MGENAWLNRISMGVVIAPIAVGGWSFRRRWRADRWPVPIAADPLDLVEPEPRVEVEVESAAGRSGEGRWTASDLALGFRGRMKRGSPPLRYQAALGLVTVAMLVLPGSYLALVFGVGGAVVMFATRWFRWMDAALGAREMMTVTSVIYVLGLLTGGWCWCFW